MSQPKSSTTLPCTSLKWSSRNLQNLPESASGRFLALHVDICKSVCKKVYEMIDLEKWEPQTCWENSTDHHQSSKRDVGSRYHGSTASQLPPTWISTSVRGLLFPVGRTVPFAKGKFSDCCFTPQRRNPHSMGGTWFHPVWPRNTVHISRLSGHLCKMESHPEYDYSIPPSDKPNQTSEQNIKTDDISICGWQS